MNKPKKILSPEEIESNRSQETQQRIFQEEINKSQEFNGDIIKKNLPSSQKLIGKDKFANLIINKGEEIKQTIMILAIGLASELGISQIGTNKEKLPNYCLSPEKLNKIIIKRNQIVKQLNQIVKLINNFSKILVGLNTFVDVTKTVLTTLKITRFTTSTAVKFIPSPPGTPGAVTSLLSDLKDIEDKLNPKFEKSVNTLESITLSIAVTNITLLKMIQILNSLDKVISNCDKEANLESIDNTLKELEIINNSIPSNNPFETTYGQFILDIVDVPFSPTISRKMGVAKNSQGIILLKTPPSFTTTPEILIEELKLIIDSNNLQAN